MCHRYNAHVSPEKLAQIFDVVRILSSTSAEKDLFPLAMGPVIRLEAEGERELTSMQWGFLPAWWKPSARSKSRNAFQRKCFNARSETVHEKPTYRNAFKKRRCLIPAVKFEEKTHWFGMQDSRPFVFAGLWEQWSDGEETVESYTILTTAPSPPVEAVKHHRMPVILPDDDAISRWLSPDIVEPQPLQHLLRPYAEDLIDLGEEKSGRLF